MLSKKEALLEIIWKVVFSNKDRIFNEEKLYIFIQRRPINGAAGTSQVSKFKVLAMYLKIVDTNASEQIMYFHS